MKRIADYAFRGVLALALVAAVAAVAHAVNTPTGIAGSSTYVAPAFSAPAAPQTIGSDGGLSGQLVFNAGVCLRISTSGTWGYRIAALADGGAVAPLNILFDSSVEGWCFNSAQSVVTAVSYDGGLFTAAPRGP